MVLAIINQRLFYKLNTFTSVITSFMGSENVIFLEEKCKNMSSRATAARAQELVMNSEINKATVKLSELWV